VPLHSGLSDALRTRRTSSPGPVHVLTFRSATRARQILRREQAAAGLELEAGRAVHSLRHTFGARVHTITANLRQTADLMGHAATSTTEGYVHRVERWHRLRRTRFSQHPNTYRAK